MFNYQYNYKNHHFHNYASTSSVSLTTIAKALNQ